jgi:hypothetical protein
MLMLGWGEFSLANARAERDFVVAIPHEAALREVAAIAQVEYGRIDYAILNGRPQVWEINLNPTIGRGLRPPAGHVPAELEPVRSETRREFYRRFTSAFEAIDPGPLEGPVVPVSFDPELAARPLIAEARPTALTRLRRVLEPLRPVFEPLARAAFPLLGRLSRRARG